jgi:hypothetical protein
MDGEARFQRAQKRRAEAQKRFEHGGRRASQDQFRGVAAKQIGGAGGPTKQGCRRLIADPGASLACVPQPANAPITSLGISVDDLPPLPGGLP